MTQRERLLSFLFDRNDKRIKNISLSRGTANDLTMEDMCQTVRDVVADTWEQEGRLSHSAPLT